MAKGVLGNDPFLRGAAPRVAGEEPAPEASPERGQERAAPKRSGKSRKAAPKGSRLPEPPLDVVRPSRASAPARRPRSKGVANTLEPTLAAIERATTRPATPKRRASRAAPVPDGEIRPVGDRAPEPATPHAASPVLVELIDGESVPHSASPELVGVIDGQSVPHPASPELLEVIDGQSVPHPASPELVRVVQARHEELQPDAPDRGSALSTQESFHSRAAGLFGAAREVFRGVVESAALGRKLAAAAGVARAVSTGLGVGGNVELDDYGKDAELVRTLEPIADFFCDRYWRTQILGVDHVPPGPAILVANHSGALPLDGPMVRHVLGRERGDLREARWLVEDQIFHAPFLGTLFNRLGAVRACPENALRLLDEGRPVIVFPEGIQGIGKRFRERYQLKRFGRGGFVKIALRTGAPIIPVAIVGAEESMPLFWKLPGSFLGLPYLPVTPLGPIPLPARWSIRFGQPLDLGGLGPGAADDLAEVQRLTERTRESIQGMITTLLRDRPSIF